MTGHEYRSAAREGRCPNSYAWSRARSPQTTYMYQPEATRGTRFMSYVCGADGTHGPRPRLQNKCANAKRSSLAPLLSPHGNRATHTSTRDVRATQGANKIMPVSELLLARGSGGRGGREPVLLALLRAAARRLTALVVVEPLHQDPVVVCDE